MMDWLDGYKETTLLFWLDKPKVTFQQLAAFAALFGSSLYVTFLHDQIGEGTPLIINAPRYVLVFISAYICIYYFIGTKRLSYTEVVAKLARLVFLHLSLTLLMLASLLCFKFKMFLTQRIVLAAFIASIMLIAHTIRVHKEKYKENKIYVLAYVFLAASTAAISFISLRYLVLPWQGAT